MSQLHYYVPDIWSLIDQNEWDGAGKSYMRLWKIDLRQTVKDNINVFTHYLSIHTNTDEHH